MAHFNRAVSKLLRLHPKFRRQLHQSTVVTPAADTAVTHEGRASLHRQAHPDPDPTVQNDHSSTDTLVEEVEESQDKIKNEVSKTYAEVEVQTFEPLADAILKEVDGVVKHESGEEDEDVTEAFPYDLIHKTRHKMVTQRLYIAVTDDDREISALRTLRREKFSHVIRVVFRPLSHQSIAPSSWKVEKIRRANGTSELRLTCPALTLCYNDKLTTLTTKQLMAARSYITRALPDDSRVTEGLDFPSSPEAYAKSRVLVVGPPDRSVDVMAVLACYTSFLKGGVANQLLCSLQKLSLANGCWRGDIPGRDSPDIANEMSKQIRKW